MCSIGCQMSQLVYITDTRGKYSYNTEGNSQTMQTWFLINRHGRIISQTTNSQISNMRISLTGHIEPHPPVKHKATQVIQTRLIFLQMYVTNNSRGVCERVISASLFNSTKNPVSLSPLDSCRVSNFQCFFIPSKIDTAKHVPQVYTLTLLHM